MAQRRLAQALIVTALVVGASMWVDPAPNGRIMLLALICAALPHLAKKEEAR